MNRDSFSSVTQHIFGQRDPDTKWSTTAFIQYEVWKKRCDAKSHSATHEVLQTASAIQLQQLFFKGGIILHSNEGYSF